MRTLLSHPLPLLGLTLIALGIPCAAAAAQLPLPIGRLSDYGAVLDRHGRDEITAGIERVERQTGIRVYILASWESPLPDVERFAAAVFQAWQLTSGRTLLVVFLKTGRHWSASVVAADATRTAFGPIDARVDRAIADLVEHDRIEEAMSAVLDAVDSAGGQAPTAATEAASGKSARGLSPTVSVLLVVCVTVTLVAIVHRRVCPRCGSLLRSESSGHPAGSRTRVYSCRRCGFRRQR